MKSIFEVHTQRQGRQRQWKKFLWSRRGKWHNSIRSAAKPGITLCDSVECTLWLATGPPRPDPKRGRALRKIGGLSAQNLKSWVEREGVEAEDVPFATVSRGGEEWQDRTIRSRKAEPSSMQADGKHVPPDGEAS